MSAIVIREASPADAGFIARLCSELGYPAEAVAIPGRLANLVADENARAFVSTDGEDVTGLVTLHSRFTLNHETPIAQITMLVVDESRRTKGVGRALVEACERWASHHGCKRIVVTTALHRTDAHAFYEKLGYRHTGQRYGKDFPGDGGT